MSVLRHLKTIHSLPFFFFWILFLTNALQSRSQNVPSTETVKFQDAETVKDSTLTYKIISSVNGTWGYDIFRKKKLFIHQPSIPGLPGNEGFRTKESAEKVAKLVTDKIRQGEMPPSVTIDEMKKLKVL